MEQLFSQLLTIFSTCLFHLQLTFMLYRDNTPSFKWFLSQESILNFGYFLDGSSSSSHIVAFFYSRFDHWINPMTTTYLIALFHQLIPYSSILSFFTVISLILPSSTSRSLSSSTPSIIYISFMIHQFPYAYLYHIKKIFLTFTYPHIKF